MCNAASYASSSSTNLAEYEDLPGHHLLSIRNLIASSLNDSYPEMASSIADDICFFMDNFTAEEAEDCGPRRFPFVPAHGGLLSHLLRGLQRGGLRSHSRVLYGPARRQARGQRSGQ